jgi:ribosomal protein L29
MDTVKDIADRLRDLDPDEIRARLLELEAESKALRLVLRAANARKPRPVRRPEALA